MIAFRLPESCQLRSSQQCRWRRDRASLEPHLVDGGRDRSALLARWERIGRFIGERPRTLAPPLSWLSKQDDQARIFQKGVARGGKLFGCRLDGKGFAGRVEEHGEGRALAGLRGDGEFATMAIEDVFDDGESKPRPPLFPA